MSKILFPNEVILENDYFKVAQDWEIPIPAFFIISAKSRIVSITEFTTEELNEFIQTAAKVRRAMKEVLKIKDVYFFQNEDSEHGFHLWLFPRLDWMEKFGRKIESVRPIMEYARDNMNNENDLRQVLQAVQQLKSFFNQAS